jgi:hypothetical protein
MGSSTIWRFVLYDETWTPVEETVDPGGFQGIATLMKKVSRPWGDQAPAGGSVEVTMTLKVYR